MKTKRKTSLIKEKKVPIILTYTGVMGCTVFALFLNQTIKENRQQATSLNDLNSVIHEKDKQISLAKAHSQSLTDRQRLSDEELARLQSSHQIEIQKNQAQFAKKELVYKSQTEQLNRAIKDLEKTFTEIGSNSLDDITALEKWSTFATNNLLEDAPHTRFFHSLIANKYFALGQVEKTQFHLAKARNIDPILDKKLSDSLNLDSALLALEETIKTSTDASSVEAKFKITENLIQKLKGDSAKESDFFKYSLKILNLRSELSLKAPPNKALSALDDLISKQQDTSLDINSLTINKLHFLEVCTNAYQLASTLGEDKKRTLYEKLAIKVANLLSKEANVQDKVNYSLGIIALAKLDDLFIEGNTTQIFNMISVVEKHAKLANPPFNHIFSTAAQGHKAAVYIEQGKKTSARKITTQAINDLSALCKKEPRISLAHYRLGILYWMQALFTTEVAKAVDSLKLSEVALGKALVHTSPVIERNILQFTAMVEGDLGHHMIGLNKKTAAKAYFSSALKNWKTIQDKWGVTSETTEGVDYCKWRVGQL